MLVAWTCLVVASLLHASGAAKPPTASEVLSRYVEALAHGDLETARGLWHGPDLRRAERLPVAYTGREPKVDATSLLHDHLRLIQSGAIQPRYVEVKGTGLDQAVTVNLVGDAGGPVSFVYQLQQVDAGWRLRSPARMLAERLSFRDLDHVRLYFDPAQAPTSLALAELESGTARAAQRLGIDPGRWQDPDFRIDYVHTTEEEVERIVGAVTEGVALLSDDVVLSKRFCHHHEVAHLLWNLRLGEQPLYALPVFQEGVAVYLGGRWGRSPEVMLQLGRFALGQELLTVDDLLTFEGFHRLLPDLTYGPAGLLVAFLVEELGLDGFEQLYRLHSGSRRDMDRIRPEAVRASVANALGMSWEEVMDRFQQFWRELPDSGARPSGAMDGAIVRNVAAESFELSLREAGDVIHATVTGDEPRGAVLLDPDPELRQHGSSLFEEHFPGETYEGHRWGLRFSPDEVGWYDYATGILLAKYAMGLEVDPVALQQADGALRFELDEGLISFELATVPMATVRP